MRIVPFRAAHLECLVLQEAQRGMTSYLSPDYGRVLEQAGQAFTAVKDGLVLGCAGIEVVWGNRGVAWSLLGPITPFELLGIHRHVMAFLESGQLRRIEMTVDAGHIAGQRWASMLGFQFEGTLRAYTPDGRDCHLYARIN